MRCVYNRAYSVVTVKKPHKKPELIFCGTSGGAVILGARQCCLGLYNQRGTVLDADFPGNHKANCPDAMLPGLI
ncbi:hypothetical protein AAFF_G00148590 [Aldrovandia affinis]|uniref:Uncharacterized protein n=1 Tax=Aldrovandia affinis TaxID=143900 RepID=A0AAD7RPL9_9TELE|nr:hypothetical protein AAFF_G00148590 [Aldrovandia affinis]